MPALLAQPIPGGKALERTSGFLGGTTGTRLVREGAASLLHLCQQTSGREEWERREEDEGAFRLRGPGERDAEAGSACKDSKVVPAAGDLGFETEMQKLLQHLLSALSPEAA